MPGKGVATTVCTAGRGKRPLEARGEDEEENDEEPKQPKQPKLPKAPKAPEMPRGPAGTRRFDDLPPAGAAAHDDADGLTFAQRVAAHSKSAPKSAAKSAPKSASQTAPKTAPKTSALTRAIMGAGDSASKQRKPEEAATTGTGKPKKAKKVSAAADAAAVNVPEVPNKQALMYAGPDNVIILPPRFGASSASVFAASKVLPESKREEACVGAFANAPVSVHLQTRLCRGICNAPVSGHLPMRLCRGICQCAGSARGRWRWRALRLPADGGEVWLKKFFLCVLSLFCHSSWHEFISHH